MRICVLSNEHYPYRGPDTEVVINTAAALGEAGANVELVVPHLGPRQQSFEDVCAYYGVGSTFRLTSLPTPLPTSRRWRVEKLTHGLAGPRYAAKVRADVALTRDLLALARLHALRLPWCFETYRRHAAEKPWLPRWLRNVALDRGLGAVAHNELCREDLLRLGFAPAAVLTAHVGVAKGCHEPPLSRDEVRQRCGVPLDRSVVGYVGNVRNANGVEDVLELAACLPEVTVMVVGGAPHDLERLRAVLQGRAIANVLLVGHRPASEAPAYLFAADVLFAPAVFTNSYFRSEWINGWLPRVLPGTPMKLFNYLAAGRPIVAADQPEVREIIRDGKTGLLVAPRNGPAAAQAVRRLLAEPQLAAQLVANGRHCVRQFTWEARGNKMLAFFENRLATCGRRQSKIHGGPASLAPLTPVSAREPSSVPQLSGPE